MAMTYAEQLRHPNWQRKRLEILQRDDFTCQLCFDKERTLHVHHKHYTKGRMAWEYDNRVLVTLCESCHGEQDSQLEWQKLLVASFPESVPGDTASSLCAAAGFSQGCGYNDMSEFYGTDPHAFMCGEIAGLMNWFNVNTVIDLLAALRSLPVDGLEPAVKAFIASLPKAD